MAECRSKSHITFEEYNSGRVQPAESTISLDLVLGLSVSATFYYVGSGTGTKFIIELLARIARQVNRDTSSSHPRPNYPLAGALLVHQQACS